MSAIFKYVLIGLGIYFVIPYYGLEMDQLGRIAYAGFIVWVCYMIRSDEPQPTENNDEQQS